MALLLTLVTDNVTVRVGGALTRAMARLVAEEAGEPFARRRFAFRLVGRGVLFEGRLVAVVAALRIQRFAHSFCFALSDTLLLFTDERGLQPIDGDGSGKHGVVGHDHARDTFVLMGLEQTGEDEMLLARIGDSFPLRFEVDVEGLHLSEVVLHGLGVMLDDVGEMELEGGDGVDVLHSAIRVLQSVPQCLRITIWHTANEEQLCTFEVGEDEGVSTVPALDASDFSVMSSLSSLMDVQLEEVCFFRILDSSRVLSSQSSMFTSASSSI